MWLLLCQPCGVPDTTPSPALHCALLRLPSLHAPWNLCAHIITGQACVPQVMGLLQEMFTTMRSRINTSKGFQEGLQFLTDSFQKVHVQC